MSYNYYSEEEDYGQKESINNYWHIFSKYEKEIPSLSDALYQMYKSLNLEDKIIKELIDDIIKKCQSIYDQNVTEITKKYENLSKVDAYIISSFTCQSKEYEYSPFIILHKNLVSENRKQGMENISKYLYIFLRTLKKLPIIQLKQEIFKFIQRKLKIEEDNSNNNFLPYKPGITKTFWGFTSINLNQNIEYRERKDDNSKEGTLFIIDGDTWGYNISLFDYYGKEKYLLEPEIEYKFNNILSNNNYIMVVSCTIVKSPTIFENIGKGSENGINENYIIESKDNLIYDTYHLKINKFICKIKIELKEREETMISTGVLCYIPQKKLKALLTYNHAIDEDFLNNEKTLKIYINYIEKEINMKLTRYKYTNEKLDITLIEILDDDNIKDFIDVDENVESKNYIKENVLSIGVKNEEDEDEENKSLENTKIEILDDKVISEGHYKNHYYLKCSKENLIEGIIVLKDNLKLIGLIMENIYGKNIEFLPIKKMLYKIDFIKCKYLITKDDLEKEVQIFNESDKNSLKYIKIIVNGEIKSNTSKYKFNKEGIYNIYLVCSSPLFSILSMFSSCFSLIEIDFSSFNSDNLFGIASLFYGCYLLNKIEFSSFNISKVKYTSNMFYSCASLKEIDLSSFINEENKLEQMNNMFKGCENLEKINFSSFKTDNVKNMSNMFSKCSSLKNLDLSSFNTNKVERMDFMFNECVSLEKINLSSLFKTSQVKNFQCMFKNCSNLKEIDLSSFNTENIINMSGMFSDCSSLEEIDLSSFNTHLVEDMSLMFNNCVLLKQLNTINME